MKLSEIIEMVEEWLEQHTYKYKIYKIKASETCWKIRFYEYGPGGAIECDTYFYVPYEKRCILNFNNHNVLKLGRDAYGNDEDMLKWYDEFERRWHYDTKAGN